MTRRSPRSLASSASSTAARMAWLASGAGMIPSVRANCTAQGVPAGGALTAPNDQLSVVTSGNPLLKPETSQSWVVGGVVNPIRGFTAELNWYDIKVKSAIQAQGAPTLYRCVYTNDPLACSNISRPSPWRLAWCSM